MRYFIHTYSVFTYIGSTGGSEGQMSYHSVRKKLYNADERTKKLNEMFSR